MKKILLIGNCRAYAPSRLKEEATKKGLVFDLLVPDDIHVHDGKIEIASSKLAVDFFDYDVYFFRGIRKSEAKMHEIAALLHKQGKRVVEHILTEGLLPEDKLVQESKQGLYHVPEYLVVNRDTLSELGDVEYPVVVKQFNSSLGKGVKKISSQQELRDFAAITDGDFMVQQFYLLTSDIRVFVVGDMILGGFSRTIGDKHDFITTRSGGVKTAVALTPQMGKAAIEATKLHGLEIAGVDIFMHEGMPYILEINASPQFKAFESIVGVNVAEPIIDYLAK